MITIIGGDFTRSWLSLPLSHGIKVKGGKKLDFRGALKLQSDHGKNHDETSKILVFLSKNNEHWLVVDYRRTTNDNNRKLITWYKW